MIQKKIIEKMFSKNLDRKILPNNSYFQNQCVINITLKKVKKKVIK
jgi:hypothetical protein